MSATGRTSERGVAADADGSGRIASLDGLRGVAIALVLVGHSIPFSTHARIGDLANLGVRVFFVLSGFLITQLLMREYERHGRISLRAFFARRFLRIVPPLCAFIVAIVVLERVGVLPTSDGASWLHVLTYTINYVPVSERPGHLGHLWSLAVEEQFYLLWPALIVLLGMQRSLRIAGVAIFVVPIVRYLTWRYLPEHRDGIKWQFQTVCDALAIGCAYAGIRKQLWTSVRFATWMESRWPVLLVPMIFVVNWYIVGRPRGGYLFGITALNAAIILFIEYCVHKVTSSLGRLLNTRLAVAVGLLSYSMYLWQQLLFAHHAKHLVQTFPVNLAITIAISGASYYCIECPLQYRRKSLSRV